MKKEIIEVLLTMQDISKTMHITFLEIDDVDAISTSIILPMLFNNLHGVNSAMVDFMVVGLNIFGIKSTILDKVSKDRINHSIYINQGMVFDAMKESIYNSYLTTDIIEARISLLKHSLK